jgi:hypothetical protein
MAKKFLVPIDLAKGEMLNMAIHNLAAAPSAPAKGQMYMNTSDNTLYWWDGTVWASARGGGTGFPGFGSVTPQTTFGLASNNGVGTTTSRTDHVHGTPVHDNAAHSTIPISALAPPTTGVSWNGQRLYSVAAPTQASDVTNKGYVDNLVAGLSWKNPVRVATTANVVINTGGLLTIDGVTTVAGDRVLVKNQTDPKQNAIYVVAAGGWTLALDSDSSADLLNAAVFVEEGTTQADTAWVMTTDNVDLGTSNIVWVQFAGGGMITAGAGLTQSGNTLNVGAGTGITVAADTVALDTAYADGRYINSSGSETLTGDLTINKATGTGFQVVGGADLIVSGGGDVYVGTGGGGLVIQSPGTATWTAAPTDAAHLANKAYVDAQVALQLTQAEADALYVNVAGDTMTGPLSVPSTPTDPAHATSKAYVDQQIGIAETRYETDIGDGVATSFTITHNLGRWFPTVEVMEMPNRSTVEVDAERPSINTVTIRTTTPPALNALHVVVCG